MNRAQRRKKKQNKNKVECVPVPCPKCGAPLMFMYEGSMCKDVGCFCFECGEYTRVDASVRRA